jgi:adenylate kinase family enzyme
VSARYRRILVVGISGAGKTTLARRIAEATGLPLVHLDREHWRPGWVEPPKPQWRARVAELAAGDVWVMDGNYGGTFDLRLPRADAVVWLDYGRLRSIARAWRRMIAYRGRTRPDMAEGCPERFDPRFFLYIWRFRKAYRPLLRRALTTFAGDARVFRITRDRQWGPLIGELAGKAGG